MLEKKRRRKFYLLHRIEILRCARIRRLKNLIEERYADREYYKKNKNKILKKRRIYYDRRREYYKQLAKNNYQKNKIRLLVRKREYFQINKDNIIARRRERYNNDIEFRLSCVVRWAIRDKLHNKLLSKRDSKTFDILPYTVEQLIKHLESKFLPGMTWKNYGKWHIDHKIADYHFKYKSVSDIEFKKCWSLTNLQPLWAKDNLSKYIN